MRTFQALYFFQKKKSDVRTYIPYLRMVIQNFFSKKDGNNHIGCYYRACNTRYSSTRKMFFGTTKKSARKKLENKNKYRVVRYGTVTDLPQSMVPVRTGTVLLVLSSVNDTYHTYGTVRTKIIILFLSHFFWYHRKPDVLSKLSNLIIFHRYINDR